MWSLRPPSSMAHPTLQSLDYADTARAVKGGPWCPPTEALTDWAFGLACEYPDRDPLHAKSYLLVQLTKAHVPLHGRVVEVLEQVPMSFGGDHVGIPEAVYADVRRFERVKMCRVHPKLGLETFIAYREI